VLPAVAAALAGKPVHVVTVNDYWRSVTEPGCVPCIRRLGITVGLVSRAMIRIAGAGVCRDVTYLRQGTDVRLPEGSDCDGGVAGDARHKVASLFRDTLAGCCCAAACRHRSMRGAC